MNTKRTLTSLRTFTAGSTARWQARAVALVALSVFATPLVRADKDRDVAPKAEHLSALASEKESRTPAQRKLSSHLLYAARKSRGEEPVKGLPTLNVSIDLDAAGRVDVEIFGAVTPELQKQIEKHGGAILGSFPADNVVHALVPLQQIEKLAERPEVRSIRPTVGSQANNAGVQNDQADNAHAALYARWRDNVDGSGVNIGTLSNGVNSLAQSKQTGDLPNDLVVLPGQAGTADEGTAMMEHIHDLAPGAKLFYADGSAGGSAQMAANIRALAAPPYNCSIIVDDISYFDESPFQDSNVAKAVNDVTAAGVLYFSSAANSGNKASNTSSAWEGDFLDGGATPAEWNGNAEFALRAGRLHNFGTASAPQLFNSNASNYNADSAISKKRTRVDLFWNDPLGKSDNDYDLVLTDDNGNVTDASTDVQDGTQNPYEAINKLNDAGTNGRRGTRIYVVLVKGQPRFLHLETPRDPLAISTHGSTHGHNASGAANAFCVAAAPAAASSGDDPTSDGKTKTGPTGPFPNSFTTSSGFEVFSSDGPRRIFYEADGTPITPGKFTGNDGRVLQKPDITAGDGCDTTVTDFAPFFGTSAAAPHAAAIAALCRTAFPNATAAQIRTALTSTALDLAPAGWDEDTGKGIVMPDAAIRALGNPPPPYAAFVGLPDTFFDNADYTVVRPASNFASQINILFRAENAPSSGKVHVTTVDGTAKGGLAAGDGSDYQKVDQDFFFQADSKGHVGLQVPITFFGDSTNQPNKMLTIHMGAVTFDVGGTATPRFDNPDATLTLLNHNPPACSVTVGDIRVTETHPTSDVPGTVDAEFPITLSNTSDRAVTVNYATAAGTAVEGTDYTKTTGTVTIQPGDTQASVIVPVVQTKQRNQPEATFSLVLSSPVNVTIAKGTGTCTIDQPFTAGPPVNISTRLQVLGGDKLLISGFIVTGADTKQVLIRGLGPSLPVDGKLTNPALQLYDGNAKLIASNDDWQQSDQAAQIQSSGFAPPDPHEAAILANLPGNAAYTAVFGGVNGEQGIGLVEVYDFATHANSGLANISTRGYVGTGDNVMIAGFIIGANSESGPARIIVRGSGPSIQGISDALQDPTLELHDSNGNIVATNNNWQDTQQAEINFTGIPPANPLESAIVATLNPDAYTAVLRGNNNGSGVGIIEVYKLN